jgi:hypothetical protein
VKKPDDLNLVRRESGRYHVYHNQRDGPTVIATIRKRTTGGWGWSGVGPMHKPGEPHVCPTLREAFEEVKVASRA